MFRRKILALLAVMGAGAVSACAPQTVYVPTPGYVAPRRWCRPATRASRW